MLSKGGGEPFYRGRATYPTIVVGKRKYIIYGICRLSRVLYIYRRLKGYFRQKHTRNHIVYKYIRADRLC